MKIVPGLMAAALTLALAAVPQTTSAAGTLYYSGNAGADCQGSSGFGAQYFYFSNQYVENTTASGQYIVCSFGVSRDNSQPYTVDGTTGFELSMRVFNPTGSTARTTCSIVVGYDGISAGSQAVSTKFVDVAAGASGSLYFPTADLPIRSQYSHMVVNCLVPAGGRIAWMDVYQPKNF